MSEILKKLGDKAKDVVSTLKSIPPGESEAQGLKAVQDNVDSASGKQDTKEPPKEETPEGDKNNPLTRYGSRPGEKRLDTSYTDQPTAIKATPVYDKGGDVSVEASKRLQSSGDSRITSLLNSAPDQPYTQPAAQKPAGKPQPTLTDAIAKYRDQKRADQTARVTAPESGPVEQASYMPGSGPATAAPNMPVIPMDVSKAPVFDEGGDVDVNDGNHQVAILEDGEKVLTPEQAEQYRKEHPEEQKGAPADFAGRVIPNPKGLKPILDTDAGKDKETDTDHLPKGAKLSTDNAPAETPKGDISNPPAADVKPEQGREVSTQTLKPYSQVVEDKAKQRAAEQVQNPGVKTIPSDVDGQIQPREEEKGTPQERAAIDSDKKNAMGKGVNGFVQLGTALIHENALSKSKDETPATGVPNTSAQGGTQPQGGLKPIDNGAAAQPQLTGRDLFKAKVAQYNSQYQQLMDKAAQTGDPQFSEKADRVKAAKEAYLQAHPWGAPESAHPGILGRVGHVAEQVLSRAPVSGPVMTTIPGSEVSRRREAAATQADLKEQAGQNVAEENADAKTAKREDWKALPKPVWNPDTKQYEEALYNTHDPSSTPRFTGKVSPGTTSGEDKKTFESTLAKIGTKDVADPQQQRAAIETAHNSKVISDEEYAQANAYLGSTANAPATQSVAAGEKRTAGKTLYFDTPNGRKALTAAEAKEQGFNPDEGVVENEGQVSKDREKNSTYRVIQQSLTQYEKHIDESKLTPKDVEVMGTVTEEAESPDYISKLIGGAFDDLLGHPITGYSEKLMKGTLTKNQYQDLSPAGRQLLADYYTTMMAHFANMKASQGTIPRSPFIIQTEMHTIPKPFLSSDEAKPSFKNYLDQVAMRNHDNVDFSDATGTKKEKPVEPTPTARPEGVPEGATHIYRDKQNNIVGYALDGQYHGIEKK
jgi:hypothetical protein